MIKEKIELTEFADLDLILEQIHRKFYDLPCNTEDGLKINFPNGWVHLRKSNTEAIIRIYAEAKTLGYANDLVMCIKELIKIKY